MNIETVPNFPELIMYIDKNLIHAYRKLSYRCNDQNQVLNAMICVTKNTIKTHKCRSRCWLLNTLRKGVGTNEVEHGLRRTGNGLNTSRRKRLIGIIMRGKVNDAFKDLCRVEHENRQIWRNCKNDIPTEVRRDYLNKWKQFMREYASWLKETRRKKIEWLIT